jgi:hypothetical protein
MACPARFERATYALEALKMSWNNSRNNGIKVFKFGVASAPRFMARIGMPWILGGIGRWLDGSVWNLSGKPTNYDLGSDSPEVTIENEVGLEN